MYIFFFKQKAAYEVRISDWSSDVCSSDLKVAVLISGRGSNMKALIEACADPAFPAEIVLVVSNRGDAAGLETAGAAGIPAAVIGHRDHPDRASFERAPDRALDAPGAAGEIGRAACRERVGRYGEIP